MQPTIHKSSIEKFLTEHEFDENTVFMTSISTVKPSQVPHFDLLINEVVVTGLERGKVISLTIEPGRCSRINHDKLWTEILEKSKQTDQAIREKIQEKKIILKDGKISDETVQGVL